MTLTSEQQLIHDRAIELAHHHRQVMAELILVLQQVDRSKLFKKMNCSSLFVYATKILGLTESVAYALIAVARKCLELPDLNRAIQSRELSPFKAIRMTAAIELENAHELIEFAKTHSSKEIDFEVARRKPGVVRSTRVKVVAEDQIELNITVSKEVYEKLLRVQSLLAQKQKNSKMEKALGATIDNFLFHYDPVKKAERAAKRNVKPCSSKALRIEKPTLKRERVPLTAAQRHAVFLRDGGTCTHTDQKQHRCNSDRWLDVHHIVPVSRGGTNHLENLTTLCSFHHDMAHQLSLPIDGQVIRLRSPQIRYGLGVHEFNNGKLLDVSL